MGLKLYNKLPHHINQNFKRELQCFLLQYACNVHLADISCIVKNKLSYIIVCIFNVHVFVSFWYGYIFLYTVIVNCD